MKIYEYAKEKYKEFGVDTEVAIKKLTQIQFSLQCWQGDDVKGFLFTDSEISGGIQVTGSYPKRARTADELRADLEFALSMIPGKHRVNLHSIYGDFKDPIDLDKIKPKHFEKWVKWAKKHNLGLDFNPTCFSHPKSEKGFTLSSSDDEIRKFWIEHVKRSREIGDYFTKELKQKSAVNIWIPDGFKDVPYDFVTPRKRLKESLDEIYRDKYDVLDFLESKLFGIGLEGYTVGSHEFYLTYALQNKKGICLDSGHFHPTESVADKIAALAPFNIPILLHISRPLRWDSDHVVIMDDEINKIAEVIVRENLFDKVNIGFDFFDASISRISAWIIGARSFQLALLKALLEPVEYLKEVELNEDYTKRLYYQELFKGLPYGAVYDEFLRRENVSSQTKWFDEVRKYEEKLDR